MVAEAHSEDHGRPPGNGGSLSERGWGCPTAVGLMGTWVGKPANEAATDLPSATATGADAGPPSAKPAIEVTTDFGAESATPAGSCGAHPDADVTTGAVQQPHVLAAARWPVLG